MQLKDKVVIITGGGRGIGYGLSTAFAKAGAKLVLTGRTEAAVLQAWLQRMNVHCRLLPCLYGRGMFSAVITPA